MSRSDKGPDEQHSLNGMVRVATSSAAEIDGMAVVAGEEAAIVEHQGSKEAWARWGLG